MDEVVITLDIDWAPDYMIDFVADELRKRNIRATWFATHTNRVIKDLEIDPLFEVGIHPKGQSVDEVDKKIKERKVDFPSAISIRTHGLLQASSLRRIERLDHGLLIDSSTYLRGMPNISPFFTYYDGEPLFNVPFFWAEDGEFFTPNPSFNITPIINTPGLKVLDFHPVHIYLNSPSMEPYNDAKIRMKPKQLSDWDEDGASRFIHHEKGIQTMFLDLLEYLKDQRTRTLSMILEDYDG